MGIKAIKHEWEHQPQDQIAYWKDRALTAEARNVTLTRRLDQFDQTERQRKHESRKGSGCCDDCGRVYRSCFCGRSR